MKKQINDIEDNLKLIKYKDQLNHFGGIYHTLFSPDGKYISAGLGQDGTIKLWDVNNGEYYMCCF